MSPTHVLRTIQRATEGLGLPAPVQYAIGERSVRLAFVAQNDVDRWARHLGMPPPWVIPGGEYGTVEFYRDPGWCGASVVTLTTSGGGA